MKGKSDAFPTSFLIQFGKNFLLLSNVCLQDWFRRFSDLVFLEEEFRRFSDFVSYSIWEKLLFIIKCLFVRRLRRFSDLVFLEEEFRRFSDFVFLFHLGKTFIIINVCLQDWFRHFSDLVFLFDLGKASFVMI